jgi:peptidoglycan/LPS O-acetylase OafA/YrhL
MSTSERTHTSERTYRADLDGLRALAILSVVLYHAGMPGLSGGFTGVDIFFVLSGYLIGGQIFVELREGSFSYREFYRRRAKRILPAFFAVLAFTLAAAMVLLSPAEAADLARSAAAATLSASNVLFWATTNYFSAKSSMNPMLMTWSLGVEEQFYAVAPLLMVLLARVRRDWVLTAVLILCVLSFLFAWGELGSRPMFVFYLLPARAWELGAGVALAVAEANHGAKLLPAKLATLAGIAGLALMVAPMFLLRAGVPFPGPAALPSVLGTVLAISARLGWVNRNVLSLRPLTYVGKVSYSFYLWHWPLLALLAIEFGGTAPRGLRLGAIGLAFVAAVVSYHCIEQPLRRSILPAGPLLLRYAVASSAALCVWVGVWLSHGAAVRLPKLAAMERAGRALKADHCLAGYGRDAPNLSAACDERSAGQSANQPVVALWGDSHSAALGPGLRAAAHAQGFGFLQMGKAACAPLEGATHFVPRIPRLGGECARFNRRVEDAIRSDPRIHVVILNAEWGGYLYRDWQDGWLAAVDAGAAEAPSAEDARALFVRSLEETIRSLQSSGKQVVVVRDVPAFDVDPLWRVRTQQIPARRTLAAWLGLRGADDPGFDVPASDPHAVLANSLLDEAVVAAKPAALVDLWPALCDASGECAYRDGDKLLYDDANHLSAAGAMRAVRNFQLPAQEMAAR